MSPRIPKNASTLVNDLKENLQLLKNSIERASAGKRDEIRNISVRLRLLICDKSNKTSGLLIWMTKECKFSQDVHINGKMISLNEFKDEQVYKVEGSKNYNLSVCDIICKNTEQDGGAHVDLERDHKYWDFKAIMDISRSEKTDLELGIFITYGLIVLDLGQRFIKKQFGLTLE